MASHKKSNLNSLPLPQLIALAFEQTLAKVMHALHQHGYTDLRTSHFTNVFLHMHGEGIRSSELAQRAGITPQSMGELIDYLERSGYVKRVPDPSDKRAKLIQYDHRGMEAWQVLSSFYREIDRSWSQSLGEEIASNLRLGLESIIN